MPSATDQKDREDAQDRDHCDPLAAFRERFYPLNGGSIYLDGNSLGLLSLDAETSLLAAIGQWKQLGIDGWIKAEPDWFTLGERLGALMAPLVGAAPDQVVVTGTTTVNLHALVSTFYRPTPKRSKIVATSLDFPSDIYALQSQILLHGGNPAADLILVPSRDGRMIDETDIIAAMTADVALCLLPSVLYRSGQLLDIERLAAAGHERGITIGFDCAHSVGAIPHAFDDWNVDFAFWCTYKYLNAGPGGPGALYVNRRLFDTTPGLTGWWGYQKERQFDMVLDWEGPGHAGAWQISTVPVLAAAPLLGTLAIHREAGIDAIRAKSMSQTRYLIDLMESSGLTQIPYSYQIGTPTDPDRRGGHVAVEHPQAAAIVRCLKQRGVIPDFRAPNVIRIAPIALSTTYEELWQTVDHLKAIIDQGEHLVVDANRSLVA